MITVARCAMTMARPMSGTDHHVAYVGLGGNLGDPVRMVRQAFDALDALPGTRCIARSRLYASAPVGKLDQPDFVNAAAKLHTTLAPQALLEALLGAEARHGRVRGERNGPRTLDLDLLLYDDVVCASDTLVLPHPRLHERAFVLLPLVDIEPRLDIPGKGAVADLARAVGDQRIAPIED